MGDNFLEITIPLPPRDTHPNARGHWSKKQRAVRKQREDAFLAAKHAMEHLPRPPRWKQCTIHATFYRPRAHDRAADGLNMIAWLKATEDGFQDAGVFENDRGNTWLAPTQFLGREAGTEAKVVILVTPIDQ